MSHKAYLLLVRCIDFRFQKAFNAFLTQNDLIEKGCDVCAIAGGVKDVETVVKHVDISIRLHEIEKVVLINHQDCGAYGPEVSRDTKLEIDTHFKDLKATKNIIKEKYPDLKVETWFFTYKEGIITPQKVD